MVAIPTASARKDLTVTRGLPSISDRFRSHVNSYSRTPEPYPRRLISSKRPLCRDRDNYQTKHKCRHGLTVLPADIRRVQRQIRTVHGDQQGDPSRILSSRPKSSQLGIYNRKSITNQKWDPPEGVYYIFSQSEQQYFTHNCRGIGDANYNPFLVRSRTRATGGYTVGYPRTRGAGTSVCSCSRSLKRHHSWSNPGKTSAQKRFWYHCSEDHLRLEYEPFVTRCPIRSSYVLHHKNWN